MGTVSSLFSHNLYAYCHNSSLAYWDSDGTVRIYGLEVAFYGIFHFAVQAAIAQLNPCIKTEVHPNNLSLNRIDILQYDKYIYEIKPDNEASIRLGEKQVSNYVDASNGQYCAGTASLILPPDTTFTFFDITVSISVRQEKSLILYKVIVEGKGADLPVIKKENIPRLAPDKSKQQSSLAFAEALGTAAAIGLASYVLQSIGGSAHMMDTLCLE